jgi:hypothetical protein
MSAHVSATRPPSKPLKNNLTSEFRLLEEKEQALDQAKQNLFLNAEKQRAVQRLEECE